MIQSCQNVEPFFLKNPKKFQVSKWAIKWIKSRISFDDQTQWDDRTVLSSILLRGHFAGGKRPSKTTGWRLRPRKTFLSVVVGGAKRSPGGRP